MNRDTILKEFPSPEWEIMPGYFDDHFILYPSNGIPQPDGKELYLTLSFWDPEWNIIFAYQRKAVVDAGEVKPIVHVSAPNLEDAIALAKKKWKERLRWTKEIAEEFPDWVPMPGGTNDGYLLMYSPEIDNMYMAISEEKETPGWSISVARQQVMPADYGSSDVLPIIQVSAPDLEDAIALAKNEWRKVFDAIPPTPPFDPLEFYGCAIAFVDGLTPKQQAALENVLGLLIEDEPEQFLGRVGDIRRYVSKSLRTNESKD